MRFQILSSKNISIRIVALVPFSFAAMAIVGAGVPASAQRIPHGQDVLPGPALAPAEAIQRMTVPDGFSVELVASEPDIVNPVAMTFDERGRVWITESLEYPRRAPGPGRDRVKVLEDTDGDGAMDKFTVYAEGLNIPSGIAVGHGGVWVANSPDILFMQDTDGDGKADKSEVVVTGFGRTDTHELPNSLTWGPDGYLYGLNGVFNHSHVKYRGKEYRFTCAMFRIDPRTRDFEIFAEGTSNPWGIAWDPEGSAFISACVIDHLWHITESGYYHRQGGPYPPNTWKIESIVDHKHQKAAYCGIHYFDSDAYPAKYRDRLYMGNIHGNCLNVDVLRREGSTYFSNGAPDFLSANDPWFMPVVQKTGPDGCLYVLDWYDRYHCYQDANRDPKGIDRQKGRLYRIRYKDSPRAPRFDLANETNEQLIDRLSSPNVYFRDMAQRILVERNDASARDQLRSLVLQKSTQHKTRMHALWSLVGTGRLDASFHQRLLESNNASLRAWGVRAAGNRKSVSSSIARKIVELAADDSPDVRLQVAIAAPKIKSMDAMPLLVEVLNHSWEDELIPHIVWQNLYPRLEDDAGRFVRIVGKLDGGDHHKYASILPRAFQLIVSDADNDMHAVVGLFAALNSSDSAAPEIAQRILADLSQMVQSRELAKERLEQLKVGLARHMQNILDSGAQHPMYLDAAMLAVSWNDRAAAHAVRQVAASRDQPSGQRLRALAALISTADEQSLRIAETILNDRSHHSARFRGQVLTALGRMKDPRVAHIVLDAYDGMEPELQPKAVDLLTQRTSWSRRLLASLADGQIRPRALNVNQVRKMLASEDPRITSAVEKHWGTIRTKRNPDRERIVSDMRRFIRENPGDPHKGPAVFQKVCGQCHKIYGEGQDVGPDITENGRSSFQQLLSNVFDPSLVIGAGYQGRIVMTNDGRVLTGLLIEDSPQRVVLKLEGGKQEVIARGEIEDVRVSELSLMPEGFEKQLTPNELADLLAFLLLDKPPTDPTAKPLPRR